MIQRLVKIIVLICSTVLENISCAENFFYFNLSTRVVRKYRKPVLQLLVQYQLVSFNIIRVSEFIDIERKKYPHDFSPLFGSSPD